MKINGLEELREHINEIPETGPAVLEYNRRGETIRVEGSLSTEPMFRGVKDAEHTHYYEGAGFADGFDPDFISLTF